MFKEKLCSKLGESIAEVLVALLIAALGLLMFASMITSSSRIIQKSSNKIQEYVQEENYIVQQKAEGNVIKVPQNTVSIDSKLADEFANDDYKNNVVYYIISDIGSRKVITFQKDTTP